MQALQCSRGLKVAEDVGCCQSSVHRCQLPRPWTIPRRAARHVQRCMAAADNSKAKGKAPLAGSEQIGVLDLSGDTETIQEVMAFKGPAPERVNGRVAMISFLFIMLTEAGSHQSLLQQVVQHPAKATVVSALISLASIVPKYASGTSLTSITEACSRDGMPPQLRFFNKTHEVWVGRVAMLGLIGLAATETVLGRSLI